MRIWMDYFTIHYIVVLQKDLTFITTLGVIGPDNSAIRS
jgi:hypothetical protein